METLSWPLKGEFRNREEELEVMHRWWEGPSRDALALVGRRRVGKSWLLRRFAEAKPGLFLVADRGLLASQLGRFGDEIEAATGIRPSLPDFPSLLRHLYRIGNDQKLLVVIDELPYLLPDGEERTRVLSQAQAVMEEERDRSQTRLVLCGSLIAQMESLLAADSPLHGRLRILDVEPMSFGDSVSLREPGESSEDQIVRYAICGGMARYLAELGRGPLRETICTRVLDRHGELFNDPRWVLEQELRAPAPYFSVLEALTRRPAGTQRLTDLLQMPSSSLWPLLKTLDAMRLVRSSRPVGAPQSARNTRHELTEGFTRFWFRFVYPHQDAIEGGLRPVDLWKAEVEPSLTDFVAPAFEDLCRRYVRLRYGSEAPQVGSWWGKSLNRLRRSGSRQTEELDVAGTHRSRMTIAGECKWTSKPMPLDVLSDLREYKLPAITEEAKLKLPAAGPRVLLFSRSGFDPNLREAAASSPADAPVELIGPDELIATLQPARSAPRESQF